MDKSRRFPGELTSLFLPKIPELSPCVKNVHISKIPKIGQTLASSVIQQKCPKSWAFTTATPHYLYIKNYWANLPLDVHRAKTPQKWGVDTSNPPPQGGYRGVRQFYSFVLGGKKKTGDITHTRQVNMVLLKVSVGNVFWGQGRVIRFQIGSLPVLKNYSIFWKPHATLVIPNFLCFRKTRKNVVFKEIQGCSVTCNICNFV